MAEPTPSAKLPSDAYPEAIRLIERLRNDLRMEREDKDAALARLSEVTAERDAAERRYDLKHALYENIVTVRSVPSQRRASEPRRSAPGDASGSAGDLRGWSL